MQEIERSSGYSFFFNFVAYIRPREFLVRAVTLVAGSVAIVSTNILDTFYDLLEQANEESTLFPYLHILHWSHMFRARKKNW